MADFLTQDDLEHLRIIAERKKIGEYILGEENPIVRKLGETNRAALVAQIAEGKRAELGRTFAQFGLDEVTSQQLQDHQAKISEAALKAQSAIAQLQSARVDYDKRIRSLLSDEDYATYRVYEDMTPARSEYTKVQTYAQEKGLALEPKDQAIMVDLIHQANSYASVPDLGPYDGVPESAVGHDAVIALNQQQLVRLTESATRVIAIATEAGLPEASRSVLESYFTEQINSKSNVLDSIQDPHRQQAFIEQARQRGQQDIMNKSANHP